MAGSAPAKKWAIVSRWVPLLASAVCAVCPGAFRERLVRTATEAWAWLVVRRRYQSWRGGNGAGRRRAPYSLHWQA